LTVPALLVAPAAVLGAQRVEVSGIVRSGEQPIERAFVEARAGDVIRAQALTNEAGRYRFTVPPGQYSVTVRRIGFAVRTIPDVTVAATPVTVDAVLDPVAVQLDHTVVTALRRTEKLLDAPASISVVDDQTVQERTAVTALDYVMHLPGVDVAQQGIQGRQVVARGFNQTFGTSLLMMSDYRTASIPSLRGNLSHFVTPTADDIDRVEVMRGPASALYGPNAADGVVHFITKSPFESPGGSIALTGGGRSLGQAAMRFAGIPSERLAFKLSGKYLRAREWTSPDQPAEVADRDPVIERVGGEGRLDWRVTPTGTAVFTVGSTLAKSHVEYTSIGASQIKDWRYDFGQVRYNDGKLFGQLFYNVNDAGHTINLRTNQLVYDRSTLLVGQLQHGADVGERVKLTYGIDVQRTDPKTDGTISGRNEDDDRSLETGAYLQAESRLTTKLSLLTAARVDRHSRLDGTQVSPRVALQFAPRDGQRWHLSYNRAFTTPTSTDLFVDLVVAQLSPLPYDIRAVGVPKDGFHFGRDCAGGLCMTSPFTTGRLPVDATLLWPAVVQILQANGVDLSGLPAPTSQDVQTVLRSLDPSAGAFQASTTAVTDIDALQPTITNAVELGYKGLVSGRLLFDASVYATRRENFRGPLAVETPNAFLSTTDLAAYFGRFMPAADAGQLAALIGGIDGNAQAPGIPLGTVAPEGPLGGSDLILTYRNFGRVELWGTDIAVSWAATNRVSLTGAYSFTSENFFAANAPGESDLSLNAPRHKAAVSARYREPVRQVSAEARARFVGPFHMVDGVWIGDVAGFGVADIEVGFPLLTAQVTLTLSNILDRRHSQFVGAPVLGRLIMLRTAYRF
jgi:iron complex outermembrane receptor protein